MDEKEATIELMTDYFIEGIDREATIKEMVALMLVEDYDLEWYQAESKSNSLVDENWHEADYRATMANLEARSLEEAKVLALRGAAA